MGRQLLLVLAVTFTVLLAGCAGLGVGDDSLDDLPGSDEPEINSETNENDTDHTDDSAETVADTDGELEIHHIDVGQGDATFIITPGGETILIDSGDWRQSGQQVIEYLDELGVEQIDHLVATHGHADHIGGHDEIIAYYETEHDGIGAAYDSGVAATSQTYERYLDAIEEYDVELFEVEEGDELPIEDEQLTALVLNPPAGNSGTDLHANSVSIVFEFSEFRYLTTGDAETAAEQRMIDDWADELEADAYHAGHHGSSTSSTEPFMNEVQPSIAIISSGYDSQYGHPHDEVLERFDEFGIETYWTGVHGDIVLVTDGEAIDVETTNSFPTDPLDLLDEKPRDDDETHSIVANAFEVHAPLIAS